MDSDKANKVPVFFQCVIGAFNLQQSASENQSIDKKFMGRDDTFTNTKDIKNDHKRKTISSLNFNKTGMFKKLHQIMDVKKLSNRLSRIVQMNKNDAFLNQEIGKFY